MNYLKIFMVLTIMALAFVSALHSASQRQKATIKVDGLACPFCAYGLEKKLKKIEGVEKLEIRVNDGVAILYFQEGANIDKDQIAKKVKEAGFTPRKVQIEGESKKGKEAVKGQNVTLGIKGMSCEGCVSRVKNALNNLDCVQDVEVSLSAEKASFFCTDNKNNPDKFMQAIEKLGFKVKVTDNKSQKSESH